MQLISQKLIYAVILFATFLNGEVLSQSKTFQVFHDGFENGEEKWQRSVIEGQYRLSFDHAISHSGKTSAKIETIQSGWARWARPKIHLNAGKAYRISAYVVGSADEGSATLWIYGSGNDDRTHIKCSTKWQKIELEFVAQKSGDVTLFLQIAPRRSGYKGFTVWFDDVLMEDISKFRPAININGTYVLPQQRCEKSDPPLSDTIRTAEASTEYVIYRRSNLRYLYPDSIPRQEEILSAGMKSSVACAQKYATAWFIIYALEDIKNIRVSLADDLVAGNGEKLTSENVKIKLIKFWKQRPEYSSATYYDIPELLVENVSVDMAKGSNQGFWVQIKMPDNVKSGTYKGEIICRIGSEKSTTIPIAVEVLPFKLETPDNIHWINYQNDERWNEMSDEQVREDITATRDYGITGMILEVYKAGISLTRNSAGKINCESRRIGLYQKYRKELGMTGPLVIAPEKYLESWAGNLVGLKIDGMTPDLSGQMNNRLLQCGFKECVQAITDLLKRTGNPDWYYYGTDEPFTRFIEKSAWENRLTQDAGVKTVSSCYPEKELKEILPYLNANITHDTNSAEQNSQRRELLQKANCEYWFLGAGSYTGMEGGLMPNRYLAGFLFYKSGATVSVHWTFCRTFDDPYNDFDGNSASERKDTCMVYPARATYGNSPYISTLQWEGLREGVDDYRYMYTLTLWIKKAREKGLTQLADEAQGKLDNILKSIPWNTEFNAGTCIEKPGTFTNESADTIRKQIANEILELKRKVTKT